MADQEPGATVADETLRKVDDVTSALDHLADVLDQEDDLPSILRRVCQQAVHAIGEADMASVSLSRDGEPETAAVTDDRAVEIDKAQYTAGQGPCLHAASTRQVVRVTVAGVRERWPDFADAAGQAMVASYLSAPLVIDEEYSGSLNLYGTQPHGFGELDAALLELYTAAAEAALRGARRYLRAREHTGQLRTALSSRAVIDQAKGIIMAARQVTADEAFTIMVEQSQRQNVKLRDLAQRFITDVVGDR
jgi:GAF domain-containing protein